MRPTIKIGLVAPFEGRYRHIGYDVIYAARLAIREASAAGGVGGYSVELVAYDDGGDIDAAAAQARKLAIDPQVLGVIGHFLDETTVASLAHYAHARLALVTPAISAPDLVEGPGVVFGLGPPVQLFVRGLLDWGSEMGVGSVVVAGGVGGVAQSLREESAIRGIPFISLESGATRCVQAVTAAKPQVVVLAANPIVSGETAASLREHGWQEVLLGGPDLTATDFRQIAGDTGSVYCLTPWPLPTEVTAAGPFINAYQDVSGGLLPGRLAIPAYEATWILIEAIERDIARARTPSRVGVAEALRATERHGLLGTVTFGADHTWDGAPLHACEIVPTTQGP